MTHNKKIVFISVAAALVAVGIFCCVFAFFQKDDTISGGQIVAGFDDGAVMFDLSSDIASEIQAEASCRPIVSDGAVRSFEMRFPKTDAIDALLSTDRNVYFAGIDYGNGKVAIPMENIRIVVDEPTDNYVLTLEPIDNSGIDFRMAQGRTVNFYIAERETAGSYVLFTASAVCGS